MGSRNWNKKLIEETEINDSNLGFCVSHRFSLVNAFCFTLGKVCLCTCNFFPKVLKFTKVCSRGPGSHGQVPIEKGHLHMET